MPRVLVLGSRNRKKLGELAELLTPHGLTLKTLADFPAAMEVEETGDTFAANAALKATVQAKHLQQWVLGEDSGLSVAALGGAPGVYSARFSGPGATDERNNRLLLEKLADRAHSTSVVRTTPATPRFPIPTATCEPKAKASAAGEFSWSPPAAAALATTRCLRSSSATARSASWPPR